MSITFVTAFFDIQRDKKGDGRSIDEYLEWIKKTLQLNANLYIVTESKFVNFMKENRPSGYATHIIEDTLENACYYKYLPVMKQIMESREYKSRIEYPDRVECKLPEYNIIQYSKFGWLERAIIENPFNSKAFFWMDIGISRFFGNIPLQLPYPNENKIDSILYNKDPEDFNSEKYQKNNIAIYQTSGNLIPVYEAVKKKIIETDYQNNWKTTIL